MGGSYGRYEATGRGCVLAAERFLSKALLPDHQDLTGARIAIQGFGDVGSVAADSFVRAGAKVIAISDSTEIKIQKQSISAVVPKGTFDEA